MTGFLTTHVLDTANGVPAGGMKIVLFRIGAGERMEVKSFTTGEDGRAEAPVLSAGEFVVGVYELVFHVGAYFGTGGGKPPFLGEVPVRFGVSDAGAHYHVPLLCSPWAYSTYRGS